MPRSRASEGVLIPLVLRGTVAGQPLKRGDPLFQPMLSPLAALTALRGALLSAASTILLARRRAPLQPPVPGSGVLGVPRCPPGAREGGMDPTGDILGSSSYA